MRRRSINEIHSLLPDYDGFWNHNNLDDTERLIRALLPHGDSIVNKEHITALIQGVRLFCLKNEFKEAKIFLSNANQGLKDLPETEQVKLQIRYYLEEGRFYSYSMSPVRAVESFHKAWEMSKDVEKYDFFAADAAYMILITLPGKQGREWLQKAITIAEKSKSHVTSKWLAYLYMAAGWEAFDLYDFNKSMNLFIKAERSYTGDDSLMSRTLKWSTARVLRALKRNNDSIKVLLEILVDCDQGPCEANGFVYLELAESHESMHAFEKARDYYVLALESLKLNKWYSENYEYELKEIEKKSKKKIYS